MERTRGCRRTIVERERMLAPAKRSEGEREVQRARDNDELPIEKIVARICNSLPWPEAKG